MTRTILLAYTNAVTHALPASRLPGHQAPHAALLHTLAPLLAHPLFHLLLAPLLALLRTPFAAAPGHIALPVQRPRATTLVCTTCGPAPRRRPAPNPARRAPGPAMPPSGTRDRPAPRRIARPPPSPHARKPLAHPRRLMP